MSRKKDLSTVLEQLEDILTKYEGIPSQKVDRDAYAYVRYYLKKYSDEPEIISLKNRFNIKSKDQIFNIDLDQIKKTLEEEGKFPSIKDNQSLYFRVRQFLKKYENTHEVKRLMYIYAHSSVYPLEESKLYRPLYEPFTIYIKCPSPYSVWKTDTAFEYIAYVFSEFHELPGRKTKPMLELEKRIGKWYRYQDDNHDNLKELVDNLINLGSKDERIIELKNSFLFSEPEIQNRIYNLIIEHGACTIHYIAKKAFDGQPLSDDFVYYFYYNRFNEDKNFRGKTPLGELYASIYPSIPLYPHYRDLAKCDINNIRERVIKQDRNWKENPPTSISEWEAYGEYLFFTPHDSSDWSYETSLSLSKSYPQRCIEEGHPYFRYYFAGLKYLNFKLFLMQNGYELSAQEKCTDKYRFLNPIELAHVELPNRTHDLVDAYELCKLSKECTVDDYGAIYLKKEESLSLLFMPINAITYKVNPKTTTICKNAIMTCEDTLTTLYINNDLKYAAPEFGTCKELKEIVIPQDKIEDCCLAFTKNSSLLFHNTFHQKIQTNTIYKEDILQWVPIVEDYSIKNGVKEIATNAFHNSKVKRLHIPGSIQTIKCLDCPELEHVYIEEGVESLEQTFSGCKHLKEIKIPNSVKTMSSPFKGCTSLEYIHMGKFCCSVWYLFRDCINLKEITFEGDFYSFSPDFFNCKALTKIIFYGRICHIEKGSLPLNIEEIYLRGDCNQFDFENSLPNIFGYKNFKTLYVPKELYNTFLQNTPIEFQEKLKSE